MSSSTASSRPMRFKPRTQPLLIVARAFQTSVKANTRNAMIATYDLCRRNNWQFYASAIDSGKTIEGGPIDFDIDQMKELYAYGFTKGVSGRAFQTNLEGLWCRNETRA